MRLFYCGSILVAFRWLSSSDMLCEQGDALNVTKVWARHGRRAKLVGGGGDQNFPQIAARLIRQKVCATLVVAVLGDSGRIRSKKGERGDQDVCSMQRSPSHKLL